jgi:hypothetical protein
VSGNPISFGGATDVADMEVPGQKQIGPDGRELRHRHRRPPDEMLVTVAFGQIEGMVRHHNLDRLRRRRAEQCGRALHLASVQAAAAAEWDRARAVEASHDHFFIDKDRFEIALDMPAVRRERAQESRREVVERHVVVAGDDELLKWQLLKKSPRLLELPPPGALRQVARDRDEMRRNRADGSNQRRHELRIDAPEMQV